MIAVIVLAAFLAGAVGGWWYCERSPSNAFLPASPGAEWIMDPSPPENTTKPARPIRAVFKNSFTLATLPANATLTIRAFKNASVVLDGHDLARLESAPQNWKLPAQCDITPMLLVGTNEITVTVTNNLGPPALWLRLQAGDSQLQSDESWRVSLAGADWQPARLASEPVAIPDWSPLSDEEHTFGAMRNSWRELALLASLCLGVILALGRWQFYQRTAWPNLPLYLLLAAVIFARTSLFIHDVPDLRSRLGFDAPEHMDYIRLIQQNGTLPSPEEGWETHQPPLYYLCSAAWLKIFGLSVNAPNALTPLRAFNGILGLIHCWLVFLCLRRLFPESPGAQAAALIVAAFLPEHLYLSFYVTNDPLAGVLVTTAFYFLLRVLPSDSENPWTSAGLGVALGAAMLTKLTVLPAVLAIGAALGLRLILRKNLSPRAWLISVGLPALLCAAICGWHYARGWIHTGTLAVPSSQTSDWWQAPGFRTAGYYMGFGQSLISPLFSGFHSFADGIYSTFWSDGLISGTSQILYRPPWNYDLLKAAILFSLVPMIVAVGGLALTSRQFFRDQKLEWFVIPMFLFSYLAALVYLTISAPWLAEVKAFYAFPIITPFCALIAAGWNWLAQRNRALQPMLWAGLLLWAVTTYMSFWIPKDHFETWRCRAIGQIQAQHLPEAADCLAKSLQLNPNDFNSRYLLAVVFMQQTNTAAAFQQYSQALMIRPDSPEILNALAGIYAKGRKKDAEWGEKLAERACQLTGGRRPDMVLTLALATADAGQIEKATATAEKAFDLASQSGDTTVQKEAESLLEQLRKATAVKE